MAGMSAEIIDLKAKHRSRNTGFGAREALIDIVSDLPFMVDQRVAAAWAEQVLVELRIRASQPHRAHHRVGYPRIGCEGSFEACRCPGPARSTTRSNRPRAKLS